MLPSSYASCASSSCRVLVRMVKSFFLGETLAWFWRESGLERSRAPRGPGGGRCPAGHR
jgi:hypothetical protein